MKTLIIFTVLLSSLFVTLNLKADETPNNTLNTKKVFNNNDINSLASQYLNNDFNIEKPAIIDVDKDGDFDILNFTETGNVEYYKNIGKLDEPNFILENKNFDNVQINSIFDGMPVPVFFADSDGDYDVDMFAIVDSYFNKETHQKEYKINHIENTLYLDEYTLIIVILLLIVVLLVVAIAK